MMTAQGYPSRVVIGFTAGDVDGDEHVVTARNAHAWPEVWFGPEHGWVRFEPTPAAAANGVSAPEVTQQAPDAEEPETPEDTAEAPTSEEEGESSEEGTSEDETTETTEQDETAEQGPSPETVQRIEWGTVSLLGLAALLATAAAVVVLAIRRHRRRAREERWAALHAGAGAGAGARALESERLRRRAGDLAWSELTRELRVRETAIRWLGLTGAWGRPPKQLAMNPALPPHRAVQDLLDQVADGQREVTDEDRAAAARLADARTAAAYAAPLPDAPTAADAAPSRATPDDAAARAPAPGAASPPQHPLRADADRIVELIRTAR